MNLYSNSLSRANIQLILFTPYIYGVSAAVADYRKQTNKQINSIEKNRSTIYTPHVRTHWICAYIEHRVDLDEFMDAIFLKHILISTMNDDLNEIAILSNVLWIRNIMR